MARKQPPFLLLLTCGAVLTGMMCSGPTSPSDTGDRSGDTPAVPAPAPGPAPSPTPTGAGRVTATVRPNPVPFSGQPITDAPSCAGETNTWFYEQVLRETGGLQVRFTSRIDSFDGRVVNNLTNQNIVVPANGELVLRSRWCSGLAVSHRAQTSFRGTDSAGNAVTTDGPEARLMSP